MTASRIGPRAAELGLRPGPRAHIVADIKRALVSLVDDRGIVPIVILDDAQGLRDDLLHELHGLTSIDFDGRDYLTLWLVGHPTHTGTGSAWLRPRSSSTDAPAASRRSAPRPGWLVCDRALLACVGPTACRGRSACVDGRAAPADLTGRPVAACAPSRASSSGERTSVEVN